MTHTKEEILDNHRSIYVSLEFQPKMKNWIYHYSTGFLNYIIIHTHSVILLDLPYAPRIGVTQMWILRKSKDLLEYIHSRFLSSCNSIKTFDFSTIYKIISPIVFHEKEW